MKPKTYARWLDSLLEKGLTTLEEMQIRKVSLKYEKQKDNSYMIRGEIETPYRRGNHSVYLPFRYKTYSDLEKLCISHLAEDVKVSLRGTLIREKEKRYVFVCNNFII